MLDLGLPDIDGLDVLRTIREKWARIPVVILTARGDVEDRVRGLDLGADDYVTKPFATSSRPGFGHVCARRPTTRSSSRSASSSST